MKKALAGLAVAACVSFSPLALANVPVVTAGNTVRFADGPGASPGGAFNLTVYNGTTAVGSFLSFCLEKNEYINFTSPYKVASISLEARNGGKGGAVNGADPLDYRTAWLYTQYMENPNALGTSWNNLTAIAKGTAMQQAIWVIEQEQASTTNAAANALITLAGGANWGDTGRVRVLNMVTAAGGRAQDQLYIMPVPEPETYAMFLAGLGLMGMIARRRRNS